MPKLRLFANLREIAGVSTVDIPASTVGGLLDEASELYGPDFVEGVRTSRIWVNGIAAEREARVEDADEVVLIPPVSGGSQPVAAVAPSDFFVFAPLLVAIVAVVADLTNQAIWSAALVGIAATWALDIGAVFERRGRLFAPLAVGVAATGSVMASHVVGGAGYGLALAIAVVVTFVWAIVVPDYRSVTTYAPTLLASVVAALAASSMTLAYSGHSPSESAVDVFLLATVAGVALGAVAGRLSSVPFLDPFSVTAVGAILATVVGAVLWDLDIVNYLLVGLGIAVALVGGRGFGSMLRLGEVKLTERLPGVLSSLDGIMLAAAIYYPLLVVIL